jgi:thiol:disulfide interchange protein
MPLFRMFVAVAAIAFAGISPTLADNAPLVSIDSINALDIPEHPYDASQDATRAVDDAFARAARSHKRVLIDLGGNWCADCRIFAGVMELPEVRAYVAARYEVVYVDVGHFNRNLQIPARFGINERLEGVPSVLVARPDGTLVDRGHIAALVDARTMTPQAIADWLAYWAH